jgi:hypothetical protein
LLQAANPIHPQARARASIDGQSLAHRPPSRAATPAQSPGRAALPCDNYLNRDKRPEAEPLDTSEIFEQAFARSGRKQEKVKKMLEKIKKKAEKDSREKMRKYKGFGEKVEEPAEREARRREAREKRRKEVKVKKAEVTDAEAALMAELLNFGQKLLHPR